MATRRERSLAKAEKLVRRGRLESAIEELHDVLKESPDDTRTLNRVGDLYARLNRVDEAVELFAKAAERFSKEGFFVKAIAIYKKILRLDPTRVPVYESLATLYQQQGLINEARGQYQVVADYYEKSGDGGAVIAVYEKLLALDPGDPEVLQRLTELLIESDRTAEALELSTQTATELLDAGEPDEALAVFLRANQADPSNLQFVMQSVMQLKSVGRPELLEGFLEAAEKRNPEAAKARELLDRTEPETPSEAPVEPELTPELTPEVSPEASPEPAAEVVAEVETEEEPAVEETEPVEVAVEASKAEDWGSDEIEIELDALEQQAPAAEAPPQAPEPPPADLEEVLAEADALAEYGLADKAIQRLGAALEAAPGHLGAYRRLIGIQASARNDAEVVRLAGLAAGSALESGNASAWRDIVADLTHRGYRIEGSKVLPPKPPPAVAPDADLPEELLVDASEAAEDAGLADTLEPETIVETLERDDDKEEDDWLDMLTDQPTTAPAAEAGAAGEPEFFDLGAELENELGGDGDLLTDSTQLEAQTVEEIVEGFKQGMAEVLSPEAYDTHYNLGVAYREMGLVDEAIGEFQLAAKDPRYLVECCSALGQSFQEKDFADLAIKWYRKGLESPHITEEETLGLLYELGNLHLAAGDHDAAREAFTEIYGNNSNFRDVVAKLEELRRGQ